MEDPRGTEASALSENIGMRMFLAALLLYLGDGFFFNDYDSFILCMDHLRDKRIVDPTAHGGRHGARLVDPGGVSRGAMSESSEKRRLLFPL